MLELWLLEKLFFRVDFEHVFYNTFVFGADFSARDVVYSVYNDDPNNDPEYDMVQEYSLNLWLGIVSFHIGVKGKSVEEVE